MPPGALTIAVATPDGTGSPSGRRHDVLAISVDGTLYLNGAPSLRNGQIDALDQRLAALERACAAEIDALKGKIVALERSLAQQASSQSAADLRRGVEVDRLRSTLDRHRHP